VVPSHVIRAQRAPAPVIVAVAIRPIAVCEADPIAVKASAAETAKEQVEERVGIT
jgi:hypothetical protein